MSTDDEFLLAENHVTGWQLSRRHEMSLSEPIGLVRERVQSHGS
jgi:hypothetical protein